MPRQARNDEWLRLSEVNQVYAAPEYFLSEPAPKMFLLEASGTKLERPNGVCILFVCLQSFPLEISASLPRNYRA